MNNFIKLFTSVNFFLLRLFLFCLCALSVITNCQKHPTKSLSVLGGDSDCYYYERHGFDIEESFILLGQTSSGKKIKSDLSKLKKLQFKTFSDLSKQEIKKSGLIIDRSIGAYLSSSVTDSGDPTLAYEKGTPLYIFTLILAHEAQHYIDSYSDWSTRLINEKLALISESEKKNDPKNAQLSESEAFELALGLKFLRTVILEYKGFSAAAAVKRSLESKVECLGGLWSKFTTKNEIPMIDPRLSVEDTKKLIELYVWGGNNGRLQRGIDHVYKNRDILSSFKEDRIVLDQVSAAMELIVKKNNLGDD